MATRTIVEYVDDLTNETAEDVETVTFALDGWYEIDLSPANRIKLQDALAPYVAAARKVTGKAGKPSPVRLGTGPAKRDRMQTKAIREWARNNGYQISDRGRIPLNVEDAYNRNDPSLLNVGSLASVG